MIKMRNGEEKNMHTVGEDGHEVRTNITRVFMEQFDNQSCDSWSNADAHP